MMIGDTNLESRLNGHHPARTGWCTHKALGASHFRGMSLGSLWSSHEAIKYQYMMWLCGFDYHPHNTYLNDPTASSLRYLVVFLAHCRLNIIR